MDDLTPYDRWWIAQGFPWCDVCKRGAVGHETYGPMHVTKERPTGVHFSEDTSGHSVTMQEWWNQ
jgi:hypothetical protein